MRAGSDHSTIVTLGPASLNEAVLRKLNTRGVAFVRINLSHTPIETLADTVALVRRYCTVPLMLDSEGSQVRTGVLERPLEVAHNQAVLVTRQDAAVPGSVPLRPVEVFGQLEEGDLLAVDFESAFLRVDDVSAAAEGTIACTVLSGGIIQSNKAVTVADRNLLLPPLSKKDEAAVAFGYANGIDNYCLSFADHPDDVRALRAIHPNAFVVAKIETRLGVQNLDGIMAEADAILIDRGDLSREVPVERLPFAQKHVIRRANAAGVPVFVATNFLDTMMEKRAPSRAETNDIVNTLLDGADGLVLAAETAIGKHPIETVSFLTAICREVRLAQEALLKSSSDDVLHSIHEAAYITSPAVGCGLIQPHGGALVDQRWDGGTLDGLDVVEVTEDEAMDAEQIALGAYSPLRGFLGERDLDSVVGEMRLADGTVWPIPILLRRAEPLPPGERLALALAGSVFGVLEVESSFRRDWRATAKILFGTSDEAHPGVAKFIDAGDFAVSGRVWLTARLPRAGKRHELTPAQLRRLFEARGWSQVVGFHTRNAPHRAHEFIMAEALGRVHADGVLIHPAVGKKKKGDFTTPAIVAGYEALLAVSDFSRQAVFATFPTYSRYAGPREALFTALCRQNYGCSHFVVGRDHTGVSDFYAADASHRIFAEFPDVAIRPVFFDEVRYSSKLGAYGTDVPEAEAVSISGTEARKLIQSGEAPPDWHMRAEVAGRLLSLDEDVFVE